MKGPNGGDNVTAGPQIGPARLKIEKIGPRDRCGDVYEEGYVVGREACEGEEGGVWEGVCPN